MDRSLKITANNIIDWHFHEAVMGNSLSQTNEMLNLLIAYLPKEAQTINRTCEAQNWDIMRQSLHRFEGYLSYSGTPRLGLLQSKKAK